jgi:predicted metal-dependent hydrolase
MLPLLRHTLDLFGNTSPQSQSPGAADLPHFAHPQANRSIRLEHATVAYVFVRAARRSIGFSIGPDGLTVRAPRWTPLYEVEAALQEKGRWVVRKLRETQQRQEQLEGSRILWADGVQLPYLGEPLRIMLDPAHGFEGKGAMLHAGPSQEEKRLSIGLPRSAHAAQIRDAVQAWLMKQARSHFQERLDHFAPQLQVQWRSLRLSSAATRWGSASADGSIRLNWRLVHFRPSVIDYVVVHELSHLRVMDHSPRFWDTVGTVVPDYARLRAQLRDPTVPRW